MAVHLAHLIKMVKHVVEKEEEPKDPGTLKTSEGLTCKKINVYFVQASTSMELCRSTNEFHIN